MLKRLRYKFILITSLLILVVILSIFLGLFISTKSNQKERAYASLREYGRLVDKDSSLANDPKFAVVKLTKTDVSGFKEYYVDGSSFSSEEYRIKLVKKVMDENKLCGNIGNVFYYKHFENDDTTIVLGDFSKEKSIAKQTIITIVIYTASGCAMMILLTYFLSFWVVKPVEESFNEQKRFIADAGHELKTPLAIIKTNMDVLKVDVGQNEWLGNIESQTERMNELIGELIDLSKAEEKTKVKVKTEFDVLTLLKTTVLQFEVLAYENAKTINIDATEDFKAKGNEKDFSKIVSIITTNAVKYATPKTAITVTCRSAQKKISFYNEGCDIEPKDKNKLFERFYRFDSSRSRSTGGSGLGLSIAKALCVANGWKIDVDCKKDAYMIFTVSF